MLGAGIIIGVVGRMWIWQSDILKAEKEIVRFRKNFFVQTLPKELMLQVSADTRYILEVNGVRACIGPCRSNQFVRYFEMVDIAQHLFPGKNAISAVVIHYPKDCYGAKRFETGGMGLVSSSRGGFAMLEQGGAYGLTTNSSWKCAIDESYSFAFSTEARLAGDMECVDGKHDRQFWKTPDFDDTLWNNCIELEDMNVSNKYGWLNCHQLAPRPIPMLYETPKQFIDFPKDPDALTIPGGSCRTFVLDAGEFQTGYIRLAIEGGDGSDVQIMYAESYCYHDAKDGKIKKGLRNDAKSGFIHGEIDKYIAGKGTQVYEPFFFRTFRFVKVTVLTKQYPLTITDISFRETGYPLKVSGYFKSDDERDEKMWEISVRTLKRCMHETYEDCPYYEQVQYIMDTRLEALFTYYLSGDNRLAKKAIEDFLSTQLINGLTACNAPANYVQVIPGFSLQLIMMIKEYYLYNGEKDDIKRWLPKMESILNYFINKIDKNTGLVKNIGYWEFADWVEEWTKDCGACISPDDHYNYLYNMMFASALDDYAYLCSEFGRNDMSREILDIKSVLLTNLRKYAFCEAAGLFRHNENHGTFSQHAQIWAVLCGLVKDEEACQIMTASLQKPSLFKCSYSFLFFFFRAMEKTGLYNGFHDMWKAWYALMELGVSTWPEDPVNQRSECHAWSSLHLYEFPAVILGVKPEKAGYEALRIEPHIMGRKYAAGKVVTCKGIVDVNWHIKENTFSITVTLPIKMAVTLVLPDGTIKQFDGDRIDEKCSVKMVK